MAKWKPVVEEQFANLRKLSSQLGTRAEYLEATNQNAEARWLRSYQHIVDEIADELTKAVAEDRNRLVRLWKSVPGVARGASIVVSTTVLTLGTTSAYGAAFDGDEVQQCVEVIVQFESDNAAVVDTAVPKPTTITATGSVAQTRSGTAQITTNDVPTATGSATGTTVHTGKASGDLRFPVPEVKHASAKLGLNIGVSGTIDARTGDATGGEAIAVDPTVTAEGLGSRTHQGTAQVSADANAEDIGTQIDLPTATVNLTGVAPTVDAGNVDERPPTQAVGLPFIESGAVMTPPEVHLADADPAQTPPPEPGR